MSKETQTTIGIEIMRASDPGKTEVTEMKLKFAELFDYVTNLAMRAQEDADKAPTIHSTETIQRHMETIRRSEEATRCYSKACELIETASLYANKGITS